MNTRDQYYHHYARMRSNLRAIMRSQPTSEIFINNHWAALGNGSHVPIICRAFHAARSRYLRADALKLREVRIEHEAYSPEDVLVILHNTHHDLMNASYTCEGYRRRLP